MKFLKKNQLITSFQLILINSEPQYQYKHRFLYGTTENRTKLFQNQNKLLIQIWLGSIIDFHQIILAANVNHVYL